MKRKEFWVTTGFLMLFLCFVFIAIVGCFGKRCKNVYEFNCNGKKEIVKAERCTTMGGSVFSNSSHYWCGDIHGNTYMTFPLSCSMKYLGKMKKEKENV